MLQVWILVRLTQVNPHSNVVEMFRSSQPTIDNENSYSRLLKIKQQLILQKLKEKKDQSEVIKVLEGVKQKSGRDTELTRKIKEYKIMSEQIQRSKNRSERHRRKTMRENRLIPKVRKYE